MRLAANVVAVDIELVNAADAVDIGQHVNLNDVFAVVHLLGVVAGKVRWKFGVVVLLEGAEGVFLKHHVQLRHQRFLRIAAFLRVVLLNVRADHQCDHLERVGHLQHHVIVKAVPFDFTFHLVKA